MRTRWMTMILAAASVASACAAPGDTKVAKWKDDRRGAFLLFFDDGWPSHWQVAIPEMVKRGLIGTFYLNPEKGEYRKFEAKWREEIPRTGMVYGNHTMSHQGVRDMEHAEHEIGGCSEYLRGISKDEGLMSYAQPGVGQGKWNITPEELEIQLKKNRLIARGRMDGHMSVYHLKTAAEHLALADKAIAEQGMEYVTIHGVERLEPDWGYQDFWPLKQEVFFALLDGLKERSDKGDLWITDHISQHKYETQREGAEVTVLRKTDRGLELELKSGGDPVLYNGPLTLLTEVPPSWKRVTVIQGDSRNQVDATGGLVKFDARPGLVRLIAE